MIQVGLDEEVGAEFRYSWIAGIVELFLG